MSDDSKLLQTQDESAAHRWSPTTRNLAGHVLVLSCSGNQVANWQPAGDCAAITPCGVASLRLFARTVNVHKLCNVHVQGALPGHAALVGCNSYQPPNSL
jgi:hypothetical protein